MQRREFLTSAAALAAAGMNLVPESLSAEETAEKSAENAADKREYIEIKIFYTANEDSKKRLLERCDEVLLPARKAAGFAKTGIFSLNAQLHEGDAKLDEKFQNAVFVFTSAPTFAMLEAYHETIHASLPPEKRIQTFAEEALYTVQECNLLRAFPYCPTLQVPTLSPDRVVQYRCYFSPSPDRNRAKRFMFDERGEMALFKRCGMLPVFFGETLYGTNQPNISYMLSFENDDARRAGWKKFIQSEEWAQMKNETEFKDTATIVRNLFLKPTPGSEF